MRSEMTSLMKKNTWSIDPNSNAINVMTVKLIYKIKDAPTSFGKIEHLYQEGLVSRVFRQIKSNYFEEAFAPVISLSTLTIFYLS